MMFKDMNKNPLKVLKKGDVLSLPWINKSRNAPSSTEAAKMHSSSRKYSKVLILVFSRRREAETRRCKTVVAARMYGSIVPLWIASALRL